jgi:hypothetical protein
MSATLVRPQKEGLPCGWPMFSEFMPHSISRLEDKVVSSKQLTEGSREYAFDERKKMKKLNVYADGIGLIQTRVFNSLFALGFLRQWRCGKDAPHGIFKLHSLGSLCQN